MVVRVVGPAIDRVVALQVREIGRWALDNGVWVVTDEIYEHLTYDGVKAASIAVAAADRAA